MADRSLDDIMSPGGTNGPPSPYTVYTPPIFPQAPVIPPSPWSGQVFNNAAASSYNVNPVTAQMMAGVLGTTPLSLPNPQLLTPSPYGVFRSPVMPHVSGTGPFFVDQGSRLSPLPAATNYFSTPIMSGQVAAASIGTDVLARRTNYMDTGISFIASLLGGMLGKGIGSAIGGSIGGAPGAGMGAILGEIGGGLLTQTTPGRRFINWMMRPAVLDTGHALQIREASRRFVRGGADLSPTGEGLSFAGAGSVINALQGVTSLPGQKFNQADLVNLTQLAGDFGILNMAQNTDEIVRTMQNTIKAVGAIAKITGDPDVRKAISLIGRLRQYGLDETETLGAITNAQTFARMAGVDVNTAINTAGAQGAQSFTGIGLTPGLGIKAGVASQGLAAAGVKGGSFSPQMLALLGGESGLTQLLTEAQSSLLSGAGSLILPALLQKTSTGGFTINRQAIQNLRKGASIEELLAQSGAAATPEVLMDVITRKPELLDTLGRELGPLGMIQLITQLGKAQQQRLGPGANLTAGLMSLGLSEKTSLALQRLTENPEFYRNMQRQFDITSRSEAMERARLEKERPSLLTKPIREFFKRDVTALGSFYDYLTASGLSAADEAAAKAMGVDVSRIRGFAGGLEGERLRSLDALEVLQEVEQNRTLTDRLTTVSGAKNLVHELAAKAGFRWLAGGRGTAMEAMEVISPSIPFRGYKEAGGVARVAITELNNAFQQGMQLSTSALLKERDALESSLGKYITRDGIRSALAVLKSSARTKAFGGIASYLEGSELTFLEDKVVRRIGDPLKESLKKEFNEKITKNPALRRRLFVMLIGLLNKEDPEAAEELAVTIRKAFGTSVRAAQEQVAERTEEAVESLSSQLVTLAGTEPLMYRYRNEIFSKLGFTARLPFFISEPQAEKITSLLGKAVGPGGKFSRDVLEAAILSRAGDIEGARAARRRLVEQVGEQRADELITAFERRGTTESPEVMRKIVESIREEAATSPEKGRERLSKLIETAMKLESVGGGGVQLANLLGRLGLTDSELKLKGANLRKVVAQKALEKGLITEERAKAVIGSQEEFASFLKDVGISDTTITMASKELIEAGEGLPPATKEEVGRLAEMRDVLSKPAAQMERAGELQINAALRLDKLIRDVFGNKANIEALSNQVKDRDVP